MVAVDFGDNLDDNLKEKKQEEVKVHRFFPHPSKLFLRKILRFFFKTIRVLGETFCGAIGLYALGAFLPQMREGLPHFYQFVDIIVHIIDQLYAVIVKLLL